MAIEADIDNRAHSLDPGMFAEVLWPVSRPEPTLFVPSSAVVDTSETTLVERVKSGHVERVPVNRGKAMGEVQEVFGRAPRSSRGIRSPPPGGSATSDD